jgi:hypothetical protein
VFECTQEASAAKDEGKALEDADGAFRARPSHDVQTEKAHQTKEKEHQTKHLTKATHVKHPDAEEFKAVPGGAEREKKEEKEKEEEEENENTKVALSLRMTMKMPIESEGCDKLKGALAETARVDASQVGMRMSPLVNSGMSILQPF